MLSNFCRKKERKKEKQTQTNSNNNNPLKLNVTISQLTVINTINMNKLLLRCVTKTILANCLLHSIAFTIKLCKLYGRLIFGNIKYPTDEMTLNLPICCIIHPHSSSFILFVALSFHYFIRRIR